MLGRSLYILLLLLNFNSFSQLKSLVICNQENEGLPLVTIKLKKANLFSVSDKHGQFFLDCSLNDTVEIHSIGYNISAFKIENLKKSNIDTIQLKRKYINLNEILVTPNYKSEEYLLGYWDNKKAKSSVKCGIGEVATFYNIKTSNGFLLKELRFFVSDYYNSEVIIAQLQVNKANTISKKLIPSDVNLLNKDYVLEINNKNTWYSIVLDSNSNNLINCDSIFVKIQFLNIDYVKLKGWIKLGVDNRKKTTITLGNSNIFEINGVVWWSNLWYFKFPYNLMTGIKISY